MAFNRSRTKEGRRRPRYLARAGDVGRAGGGLVQRIGREAWGIGVELVRIPVLLYMAAAERLGAVVLAAWLYVWPFLVRAWALLKRAYTWAQAQITPGRMAIAVAGATVLALAGSQFADLRAVTIGTDAYSEVQGVAPPPEVGTMSTGSAHAWVGLPLAAFAALVVFACARGRWRAARLLIPVGVAVVAISLFIDRPKGLDEGDAAIAYDGAQATLLGGFWVQLVAGVILIALVPILSATLRPTARGRTDEGAKASRHGLRLPRMPRGLRRDRPATGGASR